MADEPIDREGMGVLRRSAEWASKFGGGRTTNFARRKHAGDIVQYGEALADEREIAQREAIVHDRDAQNFYFRTKQLEIQRENAESLLQQRAQKMDFELEMQPVRRQVSEAQLKLNMTRERIAAEKAALETQQQIRQEEHAHSLARHLEVMKSNGYRPGSPEYKFAVEEGMREFWDAPKAMKDQFQEESKLTGEHLPLTEQTTVKTESPLYPGELPTTTTTKTVERKVSPATYEATTPQTGGEFLKTLGLRK